MIGKNNALIYCIPVMLLGWLCAGCDKPEFETYSGMGKRPVYIPVAALKDIGSMPPQPIVQTGAIFLRDTMFFMLEQKKGIHVFNLKDSLDPVALAFFQIPAITDFTIVGDRLYADSWKDFITIDISDLYHIREVNRQTDVFIPALYPPLYDGYFECVDESNGAVVDWEDVYLDAARCNTF